ncbi:carotenoid oxygenase family protein [Actinomadura rupiterrae]|uniref:carotenoid oxygenase family protein n=1 Tax=Actinomadura rupiterrae TaxID=559627 RepID=UPI0020A30D54|nr:carotenoid oxygenase family protein [Actinomadura rupiterrae]MCP2335901.1 carotenoid cleavage dioxygenase [Actinomadura rupiterrae]
MANGILDGQYAPVREELTVTDLEITGEIPAHLDGRYARIGPNPFGDPDPGTYHLFTGDGMVHGVRLRDGRAEWYRNRWVRHEDLARRMGERPRPGGRHAGMDYAVNTNVVAHAGRTFALVEAGSRPYELTDEFETVGPCDFDGTLPGGYTAHPHRDPDTGELHAVSYFFGWGNKVRYTVLSRSGRVRKVVDIEVTGSPMMHDFSLTDRYVVLYDLPVTFDVRGITAGAPSALAGPLNSVLSRVIGRRTLPEPVVAAAIRSRRGSSPQAFPYSWKPDYPARIGLLPREGTAADVRWYDVDPCYVFHPLNAYEDGDTVVLDVVRHPRMFATTTVPGEGAPCLERWTVDRAAGRVRTERVDDRPQEFPRHDERLVGRPYRYGYSVGIDIAGADFGEGEHADLAVFEPDALLKNDLLSRKTEVHRFGTGRIASEFSFVPSSHASAEDEGVLMGYVLDTSTDRSDLVFLDAATLEQIGAVHLPARVPSGFHGNWMPTA